MSDKSSPCSCLGKSANLDSKADPTADPKADLKADLNTAQLAGISLSKKTSAADALAEKLAERSPEKSPERSPERSPEKSPERSAGQKSTSQKLSSVDASDSDSKKPADKILKDKILKDKILKDKILKDKILKDKILKGSDLSWDIKYFICISFLALLWFAVYSMLIPAAAWLSFDLFGLDKSTRFGLSFEFFFYDTAKILLLLTAMIYAIAWIRVSLNVERVREFLAGKHKCLGYFMGSGFGAITPFCSCSSIPLFLGFTTARIPIGTSMAFLITSPLINEIAVVLLWGLLGWKFTIAYIIVGMGAGIIGGFVMDSLKAERWLQPYLKEEIARIAEQELGFEQGEKRKFSIHQRHGFAYSEMLMIFKRVWKWVIIGVGIGAVLHGFVPENWFAENFSATKWWTVPAAVFVAIPLYSNVTGIIPIMESLLIKGLPLGTTMAFCMSSVVASIPEFLMLRQIMQPKLQAIFLLYLVIIFILVGWTFNILGPFILS